MRRTSRPRAVRGPDVRRGRHLQTLAGWHTRSPSDVRIAQHPLTQSPSAEHNALQTAGAPAQIVATPAGSPQQSESAEHALPTLAKQPAVERHHAATSQTCAPLVSVAQQPLAQSEFVLQSAVHTVPAPKSVAHVVGEPEGSAQHCAVLAHVPPIETVHAEALHEPHEP